ncbi:DUF4065 domain-containing protein [Brevibacillus ruminantium]|uniref:DUF4065 domain-containing protein n=1 Tax=Brevibacillus ruminantium TaxID=2950604 RepID=A0ABY4WE19_9BACL|nr:type II toxin-antitoxin system antitoxin SocA domain-containing protein [Brevibacillus ruminantium]USG65139.1 DUF4065 domain-containing protein [Brevibacillus ruminantium]
MTTINDVANYFLTKVDRDSGDNITHLKLQKICYYAQAWHLAIEDEPLFEAHFEAWAHGPVNPGLWYEYRGYGWDPIPYPEDFEIKSIPKPIREFLDEIWDVYGKYSARYLENLTHQEDPWLEARGDLPEGRSCNTPIDENTMRNYYKDMIEDE